MKQTKSSRRTFWTGLPDLDQIIVPDGIPLASLNVIGGGPGTGKTVFALQMLFANASPDNRAIYFSTISEPSVKFLSYLQDFGFYDSHKMFSSIVVRDIGEVIQTRPLAKVIESINRIIQEEKARMVVIDSFKAISDIVPQADALRVFAYNLAVNLVSSMCTAFLVGEYTPEDMTEVPIFAIADGILFLSLDREGMKRQRYLEFHKLRGRRFFPGQHPMTITARGITAYPRIKTPETFEDYSIPSQHISTGLPQLDEMMMGGFPAGSATMVAGGAGTGKTLLSLHFIIHGVSRGEPGVLVTFQENPAQLRHIAASFGWDLAHMEREGLLEIVYSSPVEIQPDIHTTQVKEAVRRVKARRVVVDSLKDLEIATPNKVRYKDYVYSLVNDFKCQSITSVLTNEIPELFGSFTLSEYGVSFIADNVILLRYVEVNGHMGRALSVLKVRGSQHDKSIRQFQITDSGLHLGLPLQAITGVLAGTPVISDKGTLSHLPLRARYLVEMLRRKKRASLDELQLETGLTGDSLSQELLELQQQGVIIALRREDGEYYKATM